MQPNDNSTGKAATQKQYAKHERVLVRVTAERGARLDDDQERDAQARNTEHHRERRARFRAEKVQAERDKRAQW